VRKKKKNRTKKKTGIYFHVKYEKKKYYWLFKIKLRQIKHYKTSNHSSKSSALTDMLHFLNIPAIAVLNQAILL